MGEVYLARHLRLGVLRAIKVIRDNQRAEPHAAERFAQEAQTLSRLQHNSIVQIIEFGELENGWPFLAMEYVEGPNLDQLVDGLGPLGLADALLVLEQIASALDYAHRQNVVHRDLKPANVLLRAGDVRQVKVIDFGLARTLSDARQRLTAQGQMVGSPLYMAPEQAEGSLEASSAVDSYALGGLAYTLISGKPPFHGLQLLPLVAAHASERPQRLVDRCGWIPIPRLLDELMFACLSKEPEKRPHADELAGHLGRLARQAIQEAPGGSVAMSATLDASAMMRKETMHRPQRPTGDSELAKVISGPLADDGSGIGEALLNQVLAVVSDLAAALSSRDPELAALVAEAEAASEKLTEVEMDMAVLDSRLEEASASQRGPLEAERKELKVHTSALRAKASDVRKRLVAKVDSMRALADEVSAPLYAEVDEAVNRLRAVSGSTAT
jgi:serine/threonine-protein kinase